MNKNFFILALTIFQFSSIAAQDSEYTKEIEAWDAKRIANLKNENGFLNLAGLFWLNAGKNSFGSDSSNQIVFPKNKIEAKAGYYIYTDSTVLLVADKNADIRIKDRKIKQEIIYNVDSVTNPVLSHGSLRWNIIRRGEMVGIRLHDLEHPNVKNFHKIPRYQVQENWKISATFQPSIIGKTINITDVLGQTQAQKSPGKLLFKIEGKAYSLDVLEGGENDYFVIFADATNGAETYPSGRFVYVPKPGEDDKTSIDFNKSYNPPCAFTPYATCPLPPKQNVLPLEVKAGEKFDGENAVK